MKNLKLALLAATATLVTAGPALADTATFTLSNASPTVRDGDTVTFNAIISAPSANSGPVSISGDGFYVDAPLTLNDDDFFNDTPSYLNPGQSYNGPLFTVTLPGSTAAGLYLGNFQVELSDSSNNIFTDNASFQVTAATTATPEPGSWLLLSTGLAAAAALRRRFGSA